MGRVLDRGAIFAGWVGLGMAVVIAISFELIIAVQSLVFLLAIPAGLLIGFYADARSVRRRPWWRVLVNALYAGLLTGVIAGRALRRPAPAVRLRGHRLSRCRGPGRPR